MDHPAAQRLRTLAERVAAERARPETERTSGATAAGLDGVRRELLAAAERLDAGDHEGAVRRTDAAAWLVTDGWSYAADLAGDVVAAAQGLRR